MNKNALSVLSLLLLPVILVTMLPPVIFGPLRSESGINANGLISDAALSANLDTAGQCIRTALSEGRRDVLGRIDSDFSASGCGAREILDPYENGVMFSTERFIAMYCASMDRDAGAVSLRDMESVLRANRGHFFSFTSRDELRRQDTGQSDPETGEPVCEDITVRVYTVVYNGESYIADEIFGLSEAQKALSDDFVRNLSLLLRDGAYQGIRDTEGSGSATFADVRFRDGVMDVVYFNQLDSKWKDKPYGTDRIGGYGCGPTAMSIVVSSLTACTVSPPEMAQWSYENGFWCPGSGSYRALIPEAARHWGLSVSGCSAEEGQRIAGALSGGSLVVAIMSKGHFTSSGHFIVLRGITEDGKILVADPASDMRSQKEWDLSLILREASSSSGAGGPFWIIGPQTANGGINE